MHPHEQLRPLEGGVLPVKTREDHEPSHIGYVIAAGGAALAVIASWLPLLDESYRRARLALGAVVWFLVAWALGGAW